MEDIVLNVEVRERAGTGAARAVRNAGQVPGILYGGDKAPVAIAMRANEFRKALYTGKLLGHLVKLKYGEEVQSVIAKDVQFHPVSDEPVHFDLYRVDEHQEIEIAVVIHFRNQEASPGLKRGGSLNVALHDITVRCTADHIPEEIVVDLTGLEIGDNVRVSDLKLPANITAAVDGTLVVASVTGAMAEVTEETAEGGEAATAEEGGEPAAAEEGGAEE